MRRPAFALLPLACAAALAACGADDSTDARVEPAPLRELTGARDQAPTPTTAATLVQIADVSRTRGRIGYVNAAQLKDLDGALPAKLVADRVLRDGADRLDVTAGGTAVQVAGATVVTDDRGRQVLGDIDDTLRDTLARTRPTVNAIMPGAQSAAQSCLGDTIAQTLVGPAVLGNDSAAGAGLRSGDDAPAGVKLALCWAPHFIRDLHGAEKRLERRFGDVAGATVTEVEIGEREIMTAVVPAAGIERRELLELLAGGPALRRLLAG